jgi:hypothetical protein
MREKMGHALRTCCYCRHPDVNTANTT